MNEIQSVKYYLNKLFSSFSFFGINNNNFDIVISNITENKTKYIYDFILVDKIIIFCNSSKSIDMLTTTNNILKHHQYTILLYSLMNDINNCSNINLLKEIYKHTKMFEIDYF
jgi:hypothetical protein